MTDMTRTALPVDYANSSITELTVVYNQLRVKDGQQPIKRWAKSKDALVQAFSVLEQKLTDQLLDAVLPADETRGEPAEAAEASEGDDLTCQHLAHDDAIKFIRRHRRRRDIYVRIGTTVQHADRRDFKSSDFLRVSAKQARSAVTLLIGKDSTYLGHTLQLRIDPPSVPPGSKHKGKLFVG